MSLTQLFHLPQQRLLQVLVYDLLLILLLVLDHSFHRISTVIVFDGEENLLLLPHLDQIFTVALLQQEGLGYFLLVQRQFLLLLNLQLLDQLERSGLILAHILVPGFGELGELQLLGELDVHKLLLLR